MTRISKEWRFYRFLGASLVKRFSDTRYQALATYGIIDIWRKALRLLTPFPHGVMAAHGSLEPFVLVRVQVGELEGDMRRHVIMPPHIFYQIRSAVLSTIRFPRHRTSHRPYGTCAGWTVEYLTVGQANAVFFGYARRGGYAGFPACLRLRGSPACRSQSMAFCSCALRFMSRLRGSLHNLLPRNRDMPTPAMRYRQTSQRRY